MQVLKKLIFLLNSREKKQALLLLALILLMAIIDTLGVASILPFVTVLSNPELIETNLMLNKIFKYSKILGNRFLLHPNWIKVYLFLYYWLYHY